MWTPSTKISELPPTDNSKNNTIHYIPTNSKYDNNVEYLFDTSKHRTNIMKKVENALQKELKTPPLTPRPK